MDLYYYVESKKKKNANDVFAFSALVFGFLMFVEGLFPFTLMM